MATGEQIMEVGPKSDKYGAGHSRQCGSCVKYCKVWPGETDRNVLSTHHMHCKGGDKEEEKEEPKKEKHKY